MTQGLLPNISTSACWCQCMKEMLISICRHSWGPWVLLNVLGPKD